MLSRRVVFALALAVTTVIVSLSGSGQQPSGEPFSTAIRVVKPGLWVIPGYDGQVTGGECRRSRDLGGGADRRRSLWTGRERDRARKYGRFRLGPSSTC